jgi:ABC-2 type transport system ATP-binding protein
MITAQAINKQYGKVIALQDISFHVNENELFGFIGPDGSGKTSLFRIIATLIKADSGIVRVNQCDVVKDYKKIRNIIGYMPGRFSLYQDLSVEENLEFYATVFGTTIEQNYHLIKDIYSHIEPFKKRLAGKLSGGMKQKLALSCALIHNPKVLILDEPTTGVDAVSRKEFWEMLKKLKSQGMTIVVSTPYMDEASLCDRIALIQKGKLMAVDTPENIVNGYNFPLFAIRSDEMHRLLNDLNKYIPENKAWLFGQYIHYTCYDGLTDASAINDYLQTTKHSNIEIKTIKPCIEDCFMMYTQNTGNE